MPFNQRGALRLPLALPAYCPGFKTDSCMRPGRSGRGALLEAVRRHGRGRILRGPDVFGGALSGAGVAF